MSNEQQKIQQAIDRIIPVGIRNESYIENSAALIRKVLKERDNALDGGELMDILLVFENKLPRKGELPVIIESFTSFESLVSWAENDHSAVYCFTLTGQDEDGNPVSGYRWWSDEKTRFSDNGGEGSIFINEDETEENTFIHTDLPPFTKETTEAFLNEINWNGEQFEIVEL